MSKRKTISHLDREDKIKTLKSYTGNINRKIDAFENAGFGSQYVSRLQGAIRHIENPRGGEVINISKENGKISASKEVYEQMTDRQLDRYYMALQAFYTDKRRGTVKKYEKFIELKNTQMSDSYKKYSGSDNNLTQAQINLLYQRLEDNRAKKGKGIGSDEVILKYYNEIEDLSEEISEVVQEDIRTRAENRAMIDRFIQRS